MPVFPKIVRPCPYKDRLASVMDGDHCRMCKRDVHDLTNMDDAGRMAFLASCATSGATEICVSYRLPPKAAAFLAAAALAAPMSAAAEAIPTPQTQASSTLDCPDAAANDGTVVGGIPIITAGRRGSPFDTITFPIAMFGDHRAAFPRKEKIKAAPKPEPAKTDPKS